MLGITKKNLSLRPRNKKNTFEQWQKVKEIEFK